MLLRLLSARPEDEGEEAESPVIHTDPIPLAHFRSYVEEKSPNTAELKNKTPKDLRSPK